MRRDPETSSRHRSALLERLSGERLAGVFFSGSETIRNADSTHRFRPASDFFWLTGFREPEAALVLSPEADPPVTLFLRERDRDAETWTGRRLGVERAPEALGVDAAHPIGDLAARLPALLAGHDGVVYESGVDAARDRGMAEAFERARRRGRTGARVPGAWLHPEATVHELRLRKDASELDAMRRAAATTCAAHRAAMATAAPGRHEYEVDAVLEHAFRSRGSTGAAYTSIVAGGANACILHYVENDAPLEEDALLLVDAGAEHEFYASDVTRTFPVSGRFTPEQRALYEVVLDAQRAAIARARPGETFLAVHDEAVRRLCEGLVALGLLEGPVDRAIEEEDYREFYMHKTSHWLGLDVHDCGRYFLDGTSRALEPDMVLTVEPGLYVAEDADVDPRWRGIGIRIEDDVHVTAAGPEVLTADAPKEIDAVEDACGAAVASPAR